MARATATDIARIFGTPARGTQPAPTQQQPATIAPAPQDPRASALMELGARTTSMAAAPAGGGAATAGPSTVAPTAAPPIQSYPTQLPQIQPIGGGGATPTGSTFTAQRTSGGGSGGVRYGDPNAVPVDENLEATLRERGETGGLGTFQEYIEGRFGPEAELIDRQFKDAEAKAARDLARRGILSSGEAAGTMVELRTEQGLRKASLLGILNSEYTQLQQNNINQALNQLGVLQQGKVQFAQGITQSNIAASATVAAASIQASATVRAASIGANASVQVAKIGAQASLQRAGMDFALATRQLDDNMALRGIDPQRFQTDPVYRGDIIAHQATVQNAKDMLYVAEAAERIENL